MNTLTRRSLNVALLAGITFGCVSRDVSVPLDRLANIKKVAVVTMEPPPLTLPRGMSLAQLPPTSVHALAEAARLSQVPQTDVRKGANVLVLVFGILMLAEIAADDQAAHANYEKFAKSPVPLESVLSADQTWLPTVVVAMEIERRLDRERNLNVTLKKGIVLFPGVVDRRQTYIMENWLAPIRAWYNSDRSVFSYSDMASDGVDAVLEVGILNYELTSDIFLFQVMLKLIDTKTGEVIGRAREWATPSVDLTWTLFTDEQQPFKKLVAELTKQLVPLALRNVGLLN